MRVSIKKLTSTKEIVEEYEMVTYSTEEERMRPNEDSSKTRYSKMFLSETDYSNLLLHLTKQGFDIEEL